MEANRQGLTRQAIINLTGEALWNLMSACSNTGKHNLLLLQHMCSTHTQHGDRHVSVAVAVAAVWSLLWVIKEACCMAHKSRVRYNCCVPHICTGTGVKLNYESMCSTPTQHVSVAISGRCCCNQCAAPPLSMVTHNLQ